MATSSDYPRGVATDTRARIVDEYRTIALNRISWGAVLAGVVTALVVHLLLNVLGIGIGLTTIDPVSGDTPQAGTLSVSAAVWWTISGILASFAGGYVAGRLTGRPDATTGGWHGFVAWALTTLVIVYLLTTSVSTLIGGALNRLGALGQVATQATSQIAGTQDPFSNIMNELRDLTRTGAGQAAGESLMAAVRAAVTGDQAEAQAAMDRAAEALAQARGVSVDEARQQITQWQQQYQQAAAQMRRTAEATANVAAQVAIYGVLSLVLGAVAAYFGGALGRPRREGAELEVEEGRVT